MATRCLTLYPGKSRSLPTAFGAPMTAPILLTLKSFEDVIATRVTDLRGGSRGLMGASSAAANEHHK